MIARPKISRNEWKTAERGAFEVGNFALFSCPEARVAVRGRDVARPQELLGGPVARDDEAARAQGRVDDGLGPDALGDARELELDLARAPVPKYSTRLPCERN